MKTKLILQVRTYKECASIIGDFQVTDSPNTYNIIKDNVIGVNINNNGYTSRYLLVIEEVNSMAKHFLIKIGNPEGSIPLFSLKGLQNSINEMLDRDYEITYSSKLIPNIRVYNKFKVTFNGYTLNVPQSVHINELARIDVIGLDTFSKIFVLNHTGVNRTYSKIIRTDKAIKLLPIGSNKETYFYETEGGAYPSFISEVPNFRYRNKEELYITEAWYSGNVHSISTMEAPEPEGVIYKKVYDANKQQYVDTYVADCKLTQAKQQNLVEREAQIGLNLFTTKCLEFSTKDEGVMHFPVQWKSKSYRTHNFEHAEPLSELTLWLNKYLRAQLIENVYSSLEEFLKYNPINAETFSKEKAELALIEIAKALCINEYFWLRKESSIAIYTTNREVIHEIPITNTSVLYEDSYIEEAEDIKEVVEVVEVVEEEVKEVQKVQKVKIAYVWVAPETPKNIVKRIKSKYEFTKDPSKADIALAISDGVDYISLKVFRGVAKKNKLKLEYHMYRL